MRKLLYLSLIALAGCTTSLSPEPQPVVTGSGISNYFWPDSNIAYTYQSSTRDNQTVYVSVGGTAVDIDQNTSILPTAFTITRVNGTDGLSGFSHTDIFGFDSSLQVVTDTALPGMQTAAIRSIATATLGGFGQPAVLYAASDSVLYAVPNNPIPSLVPVAAFPKRFTLAEDAQNEVLFAYQPGGDSVMWTINGSLWIGDTTLGAITAFASAIANHYSDFCWFACGTDIYRITVRSAPQKVASLPSKVVALTGENIVGIDGVVAGLDNGTVYDVTRTGQAQSRLATAPAGLVGVALVSSSSTDPVLAGTSSGVFTIPNSGPATQIDYGAVSAIYSTGSSIFAGVGADSVFHYNANGTRYGSYANPIPGVVTQFARPTNTVPNASQGIYVLIGTSVFRRDSVNVASWTPINQVVTAPPTFTPGSLTLLDSNSTWIAGYVESAIGGLLRGYAYYATSSGPFTSYTANGTTFNNVLIVNYTAKASGIANTTNVPEYTIYYEKGKGPVIIEKYENGQTITTSLVK
jgi:hypothetical protein